jgi:very-short-patch-repair endonuclease
MTSDAELRLREIAAIQHGVVDRAQARGCGLARHEIEHLVSSGRWEPVGRSGLVLHGTPDTDRHRCALALRARTSTLALSHETAAAIWGVPRFSYAPAHVLARNGANLRPIDGVVAHHARRLLPHHVVEIDGLLVTSPERTIFDLSGTLRPLWRVEDLLEEAWAMRLVSYPSLVAIVEELSGRGQRNVAQLRQLVVQRGPSFVPAESNLERRFHRILADAGLPPMIRQAQIVTSEGWVGRVDAVYPDRMMVVEVDGARWHSTSRRRADDDLRDRRLTAAGYLVLRFTEEDVWHRRAQVVAAIRAARTERASFLRSA